MEGEIISIIYIVTSITKKEKVGKMDKQESELKEKAKKLINERIQKIGKVMSTKELLNKMKEEKAQKLAEKIFREIEPRLAELWNKLIERRYNMATQYAYMIGFVADIQDALLKFKLVK